MNLVVVPTVLDFANRIINLGGIESVNYPENTPVVCWEDSKIIGPGKFPAHSVYSDEGKKNRIGQNAVGFTKQCLPTSDVCQGC